MMNALKLQSRVQYFPPTFLDAFQEAGKLVAREFAR